MRFFISLSMIIVISPIRQLSCLVGIFTFVPSAGTTIMTWYFIFVLTLATYVKSTWNVIVNQKIRWKNIVSAVKQQMKLWSACGHWYEFEYYCVQGSGEMQSCTFNRYRACRVAEHRSHCKVNTKNKICTQNVENPYIIELSYVHIPHLLSTIVMPDSCILPEKVRLMSVYVHISDPSISATSILLNFTLTLSSL